MRIQTFFISLLLFIASASLHAQTYYGDKAKLKVKESDEVHYRGGNHLPSFVKLSTKQEIPVPQFSSWLKRSFQIKSNCAFKIIDTIEDALGNKHFKFQQTYEHFPIEGHIYIAHGNNGKIVSMNGKITPDVGHLSSQAAISERTALSKAIKHVAAEEYIWDNSKQSSLPHGELVVIESDTALRIYRLAYKFDIYAITPMKRAYVYVDAMNGKILFESDQICFINGSSCKSHSIKSNHSTGVLHQNKILAEITGTAVTKYSGIKSINTESFAGGYRLRENGRGNGIETYTLNNTNKQSYAVDVTDADNYWNETQNNKSAAYDAHWGAEKVYDYYKTSFNRNSLDDNGLKLLSYVNFSVDYDNAFWNGSSMNYGDGSNKPGGMTSVTALDVVGHEFTHGLTHNSAKLVYKGESGALNESFSDIFATLIEYNEKPGGANYQIGEQIVVGGGYLRDLSNPKIKNQPDTYKGEFWSSSGEVHTNSGIGNYWFYLIAEGGSGTNDNNNSYTVTGISKSKAAAIAYRTLTVYLTPFSDYNEARFYSIKATVDLYGTCSPEVVTVTNAWYAVGLGNAYTPNSLSNFTVKDSIFCTAPAVIPFKNLSVNASSYTWNFGDGQTSNEENPSHTYNSNGKYTVSLLASGGSCGSNTFTKTDFIIISNSDTCVSYKRVPADGKTIIETACSGTFYDDGGPLNNYSNNSIGFITIQPKDATAIQIRFSSLDFANGDFVSVFDGPNSDTPIASYNDPNFPLRLDSVMYSTGNVLTIRQYSNGSSTAKGFEAHWQCITTNDNPVAIMNAVSPPCGGRVEYKDLSVNNPTSWYWDFGDGTTSNEQNPIKIYTSSGTYDVSLKVCNGNGCDIQSKTAYVNINLAADCFVKIPDENDANGWLDVFECNGIAKDDGGDGNYKNGSYGYLTISPIGANAVILNFTTFDFKDPLFDFLYIYDGPDFSSPLIGRYTGNELPNGGTIISSGGTITLFQTTGSKVSGEGFVCNWSCINSSNSPIAKLTAHPKNSCDGKVLFHDQSVNDVTSCLWDFGDGTTSTEQNPLKTYSQNGTYTVSLKVCNDNGCDIKTLEALINVDIKTPCPVILPNRGEGIVQTSCSGILKDDGGDSNYGTNSDGSITIAPEGASTITLNFTSFDYERGWDFLHIFDGPTSESPLLGVFSGQNLPNGGTITSSSNAITIKQESDEAGTLGGFVCAWDCNISTEISEGNTAINQIKIFPSPAINETTIVLPLEGTKTLKVYIKDVMQQTVFSDRGSYSNEYNYKLNLSSYPKGLYFVYIELEDKIYVKKLIVN